MKLSVGATTLLVAGASALPGKRAAACNATSNYAGWSSMKYSFIFGDSYTTTGFNDTQTQPSPSNPLGNPAYPGYTASNGPNWVDYLTVKYNASILQTYDLAYGGATVDSTLVTPYEPTVLSLKDQIATDFNTTYPDGKPSWTSADTLFGIWIGINDCGNSYSLNYNDANATTVLNGKIFAVYESLVNLLYADGARNFFFVNVPPTDRSPLMTAQGATACSMLKSDIAAFNGLIENMAANLKSANNDTNVWVFDANTLFGQVLDNPSSYPQTAGYLNTTAYCDAYQNGTPSPTTLDASCGIPVNEYFWLNSLHPTYPMHDVVAQELSKALAAGPNVCPIAS